MKSRAALIAGAAAAVVALSPRLAPLALIAVMLMSAAACAAAAVRAEDAARRGWRRLALGHLFVVPGLTLVLAAPPGSAASAIGWFLQLPGFVCFGLGARALPMRRPIDFDTRLDKALVLAAAGLVLLQLLVIPVPAAQLGSAAASAITDILLVVLFVPVIVTARRELPTHVLLACMPLLAIIGDITWAISLAGGSRAATPYVGFYALGFAAIAAAALHPSGRREPVLRGDTLFGHGRIAIIAASAAALPVTLVILALFKLPVNRSVLALSSAALTAILVARIASAVGRAERHSAELHLLTRVDPLTRLPNRRSLDDALEHVAPRSTCFFMDLDGFKAVNDTYGHDAGDIVLAEVARRLTAAVRADDLVVRLGGDEFVIVSSTHDVPGLVARLEEVVAAPLDIGSTSVHIGTSIGVAEVGAFDTPEEALRAADGAMYERKQDRRRAVAGVS